MYKKLILWSFFFVFSIGCISWLATLVVNAARSESIRWGAKKIRAERALKGEGPIIIGVAGGWQNGYQSLLNGVNMALNEINSSGGILGRPVSLDIRDDKMSIVEGMQTAQEFADNLDMVAVIAHPNSKVSLSTAVIYEYYGLLMLSPLSTSPALTQNGRTMIFRNIPDDEADGNSLAEYAARKGYRNVAIYYLRDDYARGLANIFERRCYELSIQIVDRLPFETTYKQVDYSADFTLWKRQFNFDAVFLAGYLPQAAQIIQEIRKAGIDIPILTGGSLDKPALIDLAGNAANGVVVVSTFDPYNGDVNVASFCDRYQKQFKIFPDRNAAQGYDALKLLAHVITKAGSTVPEKMAETLRHVKGWKGVTGSHTFDDQGNVHGKPIVLKEVRNKEFQILRDAVH